MLTEKPFKISDHIDMSIILNQSADLPESKRDKLWKENIDKCKMLLGNFKEIRMKIVELALRCCIIHKGGRRVETKYTVKNFAQQAGINPATLYEWMRMRDVALALSPKDRESISFKSLSGISKNLKSSHTDKTFKKDVNLAYKKQAAKHPHTIKMEKYLKALKAIKFNSDHIKGVSDCDPEIIYEIVHICRSIVNGFSKFDKKDHANV